MVRHAAASIALLMLAACGTAASDEVASIAEVQAADTPDSDTPESDALDSDALDNDALDNDITPPTVVAVAPESAPTESATAAIPLVDFESASFDLEGCPDAARGAVADKANQRYWLCADGRAVTDRRPMTTASGNYGLPPVGTYPVFARDEDAFGIHGEPLERFVAFYTTPKGNRIAFHEVVDQDPDTVGDLDQRGASAGCFRIREDDSIQVWNHLQLGDPVVVISN